MNITVKGKEVQLKFTYNSFRHMGDLDISEIGKLETNPFKLIGVAEILLLGAINNNPKRYFDLETVQNYLEGLMENGELLDFTQKLMEMLEESSFFKNLQGEEISEKVPQAKKK